MNRKEKIESITQHEDRNKLDWDDNVLVQPEEGEGSGKNGTERKHFKMSLRKLAPDTDWSEPTDDTPPSGKLVKDSLEQIELTPGPQGDDGLSAYEVAVEEGFEGDETAWLASLKGADGDDGDDGLSAYEVAVEEGFEGDETAWLASLKGADGDDGLSAYEVAVEEGYTGTEQEFAEALADVENKLDKSKIVTTWNSPKDNEVPSAKLVHESLNGGGGGEARDFVIIGIDGTHGATEYDVAWRDIVKDQPTWQNFWGSFPSNLPKVFKFLDGTYTVPSDVYHHTNSEGYVIFPSTGFSYEGVSGMAIIVANSPIGGTVFLPAGYGVSFKNLWIKNNNITTFGVLLEGGEGGYANYACLENVIVEDMIGVGIVCPGKSSNIMIKNCKAINCGSAFAGQQASGIAVTETNSNVPSNIVIDSCTVIGGAYAGIGLVGAEDCKVVNCHVHDYGQVGIGIIGGKRNILANNTSIFNDGTQGEASPASQEFGILLSETEQCVVHGNNLPGSFLYEDNVTDCVVIDNIADNITPPNWEDKDNKLTAWGASPTDEQYPSAKLVKTALDGINVSGKEDKSNKITRLYDGVTDTQYASAKAVWDEFQIMKGHIAAVTSWAQLTDIVQQNDAGKYFRVGDEFICGISGLPPQTVYILGLNQDKKVGDPTAPTMSLAFKNILWRQSFDSAESSPSNPDSDRETKGNNRWMHSNLRQFLNSDEAKYIWASTHPYDNAPDSYDADSLVVYNGPGFLHRVESSLRDVIIPVTKLTAQANIDGTGADQTEDKIFLMSRKEVGLDSEGDDSGEFVYQYYEDSINADRIKLEASGSAYYWWLRSPNVSTSYRVRSVLTGGRLNYSSAHSSSGVSPAFVIG